MTQTATGAIRRADRSDAQAVSRLRTEAYAAAPEFIVKDDSALHWSAADDEQVVLVAWDALGNALSTTRGDLLWRRDEAERWMECRLERIPIDFPALLLGKGATLKAYERHGLHSALRLYFIEACRESRVQSLVGIVYEDAPRTRLMRAIGYDFYAPLAYWYTDLEASRRTLIGVLPRERFASAARALRERVGDLLAGYPCDLADLVKQIDSGLTRATVRPTVP